MTHTGETMEFPHDEVNGLVVVDTKSYYAEYEEDRPKVQTKAIQELGLVGCRCEDCRRANARNTPTYGPSPYEGYEKIKIGLPELTDHQAFLLPSLVYAMNFRTLDWRVMDVAKLCLAKFRPNILKTLVMSEERQNILKALSKNFVRSTQSDANNPTRFGLWSADFMEGKGKSEIIPLHGRPGVGKTYTAECIAERTKRPLLVLTCAHIGTDSSTVEENLKNYFSAAKKWPALVLIDEADIYMEKRATNDLERNSLVATFLRALEYFEGMLFLTTNRVGAFDDAVVSRVHVKLWYPELKDADRQLIWKSFVKKLIDERRAEIYVTREAKDCIEGKAVRELGLNGREIRNAFQTAVALAEFDHFQDPDHDGTVLVEERHIEQVVQMTREFHGYLDDLHQADEAKRAARNKEWLERKV
ncbi:hypothetical protein Q7P37_002279 [Cladosporium fusiforme]